MYIYVPEADEVAEEAVVPVNKGDLAIAGVESDVEERGVDGVEGAEVEGGEEAGDVEPDVVGEDGRHGRRVAGERFKHKSALPFTD